MGSWFYEIKGPTLTPGPSHNPREATCNLKEHEDEHQDVEYVDAQHQPPEDGVWSHEGAIRHVNDSYQ